jgi:hypothetical protein
VLSFRHIREEEVSIDDKSDHDSGPPALDNHEMLLL